MRRSQDRKVTKQTYVLKQIKFSTVYLKRLEGLLDWLQTVFKSQDAAEEASSMTASVLVTVHATLAGLAMW
jgi:hypothetical protein